MLLPLITPTGSDFIKDFPSQHAENAELIDAYAHACLTSDPLGSYAPLLTATTDPTIGTGGAAGIKGYYYEIMDQIYTWGEFRFGTSGMNAGSGNYRITLPFPVLSNMGISTEAPILGHAIIWDDSAAATRQSASVIVTSTTEIAFFVRMDSGLGQRTVSATVPFAWAAEDGISWFLHYQRIAS